MLVLSSIVLEDDDDRAFVAFGKNHAFPFGYAPQGCARRPTGDWNAWRHPVLSAAATRLLAVVVLGFRIVECLENAGVDCIVRESLELRLDSVEGAKSGKESAALDGPCVIDRSVGSPLPVAEKRCEGVGEDGSGGTLGDSRNDFLFTHFLSVSSP